jgi:hypothetical protein
MEKENRMKNKTSFALAVLALWFASLACNLNLGGPEIPEDAAPPATPEQSLEETWTEAVEQAIETGQLTVTLSEAQLTAYVAEALARQEEQVITDPQVILREGEMEIIGTYTSGNVSATMGVVMQVSVDEDGTPHIEVISGAVGPIPLPEDVLQSISDMVNEGLSGDAAATSSGFNITGIQIVENAMILTGTYQP